MLVPTLTRGRQIVGVIFKFLRFVVVRQSPIVDALLEPAHLVGQFSLELLEEVLFKVRG